MQTPRYRGCISTIGDFRNAAYCYLRRLTVHNFALLCTLLIAGRLFDHVGRRPVIAAALLINIVTMFCFLFVSHPYGLVIVRIVQGFVTGLATAAVGAALLDVHPERGSLVDSIAPNPVWPLVRC